MKDFFNKLFTLRRLFLWGNVILFVLLVVVIVKDHDRGWKDYQDVYKKKLIASTEAKLAEAETEEEKVVAARALKSAKSFKKEIRQLWIEDINAIDRCITCHAGYDPLANPSLMNDLEGHPYSATGKSPAFDIHKAHDISKFGCVVCHGGQGFATETKAAHGYVKHWEKPLLKGAMVQASCVKCHSNETELKINGDLYTKDIVRGEELFEAHGCIGCHQIDGEGGPISVDLKHETSKKPLSRIDFAYTGLTHEDASLENWIKYHFIKDPATLVPGDPKGEFSLEPIAPSGMPPYMMKEEDANALTAYILGLNEEGIPPEYKVAGKPKPEPVFTSRVKRGEWVYKKFGCAACHGADARGGVRNYNYQYDTMPNLRRAVDTYSREELREKINKGVPLVAKHDADGPQPPLYMPPWEKKISKQEMDDLISYLYSIKE